MLEKKRRKERYKEKRFPCQVENYTQGSIQAFSIYFTYIIISKWLGLDDKHHSVPTAGTAQMMFMSFHGR